MNSNSLFAAPLNITTVFMENDDWDPEDLTNTIHTIGSAACDQYGKEFCTDAIKNAAKDALDLFFGLWSNDDDYVGMSNVSIDSKYGAAHTGSRTEHSFPVDFWQLFEGSSYRFWVAYDVRKVG
jgi:hypothetical protein